MPLRIFHIIPTLGRGGAERQLVNLVCNMERARYEHVVCYLQPPAAFAAEIAQAGHTVIGLNIRQKWPWLTAPVKLLPHLRAHQPDIIQTWLFEADVSARLTRLFGHTVPIINTLHLTSYEPETIRAANWPAWKMTGLRWLDKLSTQLARPHFTACSRTVMESAQKHIGIRAERIRVIYNSIDPETLRCAPDAPARLRAELGLPADGFVYLNVGRLAAQKGQAYLLRAFRQVAAAVPTAYLVIIGDGPAAEELKQLCAELGLDARVRFTGRRSDVGACLEVGDVFVFPSMFEGHPLAPIEAMIKGLPCIASRIGPALEVITNEQTGLLVAPGAVDELAAAMLRLYREPTLRQRLATEGQQMALARFHSRTGMQAWEDLYQELTQPAERVGTAAEQQS
jgi:glycosyltransferase involved in cell wall biosynthesis